MIKFDNLYWHYFLNLTIWIKNKSKPPKNKNKNYKIQTERRMSSFITLIMKGISESIFCTYHRRTGNYYGRVNPKQNFDDFPRFS